MFSWHSNTLRQLLAMSGRLPHALMLQGQEGTGVFEFGFEWARSLLCENLDPESGACGRCMACNWFSQGNHPDFRLVQPESFAPAEEDAEPAKEKKSEQIRIDQVRALQEFIAVGTHRSRSKVVLLHPADTMNAATQNALLKSLEEPPARTVFILATTQPHRLLPTVRSRCQFVSLPKPSAKAASAWLTEQGVQDPQAALDLAGGAPMLALELSGRSEFIRMLIEQLADPRLDPIAVAAACQSAEPAEFVTSLYRWCYDLLSLKMAAKVRYHAGRESALAQAAARSRPECIAAFLRTLAEARSLAQHPLNTRLFFEDLLIGYLEAMGPTGRA